MTIPNYAVVDAAELRTMLTKATDTLTAFVENAGLYNELSEKQYRAEAEFRFKIQPQTFWGWVFYGRRFKTVELWEKYLRNIDKSLWRPQVYYDHQTARKLIMDFTRLSKSLPLKDEYVVYLNLEQFGLIQKFSGMPTYVP